jgi:hypothetical protein
MRLPWKPKPVENKLPEPAKSDSGQTIIPNEFEIQLAEHNRAHGLGPTALAHDLLWLRGE